VYVGGVLILMIFAFMLSNKELLSDLQNLSGSFIQLPNWQSLALSLGFLGLMIYGIWQWNQGYSPAWIDQNIKTGQIIHPKDNNINQLGVLFMSRYILPFEIISIFLMMTLIGAAHIARKGEED
ncbi:NADH-quinone oxidoreductase subunit J, partial [Brucella sp. 21LCYQ03]|nr:NADH-quinone oxidoreductase subunit J [Brucella sp. 21LCYQ03]